MGFAKFFNINNIGSFLSGYYLEGTSTFCWDTGSFFYRGTIVLKVYEYVLLGHDGPQNSKSDSFLSNCFFD